MAGIRTVAMCEKDAFCRSVLLRRWLDVPIYEDITALSGEEVIGHGDSRKKITVIHGGFPYPIFRAIAESETEGWDT
jgi:DNA (cytosine-5)-methyltransferase 1